MKLKSFQIKFGHSEFLDAVLQHAENCLSRHSSQYVSRHSEVIPHTGLRFFITNSKDLYLLLLNPTGSSNTSNWSLACELMADAHKFANSNQILDVLSFDIVISPRDFSSFPGYEGVIREINENPSLVCESLNACFSELSKDLIKYIKVLH